ncbi:MAG: Hsp70 family protein, partial [Bacteroidales bacterium]|nr:Hsp70 family protein [Bacteroidales bacterium]
HVLQGERPMAAQNKSIGRFHLDGIPAAMRGIPQIEVTFDIDSNGILNVTAKDKASGKEQKIRIEASSGLSDAEIKRMKAEAEANADADKKAKEEIDKLNAADSLVFTTEKQLKEFGDKVPADDRAKIEAAAAKLREAHGRKDIPAIDAATAELQSAWQAASAKMYQQGGGNPQQGPFGGADPFSGANPGAGAQGPQGGNSSGNNDGEVQDVDFEEVR